MKTERAEGSERTATSERDAEHESTGEHDRAVAAQNEMLAAARAGTITIAAALDIEEEETPPDPMSSQPPPPGTRHGPFLVQVERGRPERVLVEHADGVYRPLGPWLSANHPLLDGTGVLDLLLDMGLPDVQAERYARERDAAGDIPTRLRDEWGDEAYGSSAYADAEEQESRHRQVKDSFSRAFIDAQKKKKDR